MSEDRREEKALEAFLKRGSRVSKAYQDASEEQPPEALDEAILAASRRAVGSGPRRLGWTRRWGTPLAAAAVLVLAVAVVINLQDEPRIALMKELESLQASPDALTPGERPQSAERDAAASINAMPQAEIAIRRAEKKPPSSASPAPAQSTGKSLADRAPPPSAPQARLADQAQQYRADVPAEPAPDRAGPPDTSAKSAATGVRAVGDSASQASRSKLDRAEELKEAGELREEPAASATPIPPETLLEQIEALYAQGRSEEGDRALREFCRGFPQYRLPEQLGRHAARLGLDCAPVK